jgi:hypothetical protein
VATVTRVVRAHWDDDAKVWHASSDDVPGLVAEETSYEALLETVLTLAFELLRLNGVPVRRGQTITLIAERRAPVHAAV